MIRREVLRYLGYKGVTESEVDPRVLEAIDEALETLRKNCRPRFTSKIFPLHFNDASISFGNALDVSSKSLLRNLRDCQQVVLMAATLGTEADRLISRWSRADISRGVIMEAAATALIEEYCDQCQMELEQELNQQEKSLRPRFSPGYGDFDIKHQVDLLRLLDTQRQLGLTLTDGGMMAPSKSVTAVLGIYPFQGSEAQQEGKQRCNIHGCEACKMKNCLYRRNV